MNKSHFKSAGKQGTWAANPDDVSTLDSIIRSLYESVSFPPSGQPDYKRLRSLFHPEGRLTPPKEDKTSKFLVLDVESFIKRSTQFVVATGLERKGFHEKEIARRTESFGPIVHVFSTYESRHRAEDPRPIQRGINSIQLVKEDNRWWVLNILWELERPGNPIPKGFLV